MQDHFLPRERPINIRDTGRWQSGVIVGSGSMFLEDCTGMDTPLMALKKLGVQCRQAISCDIDQHVKGELLSRNNMFVFSLILPENH